MEPKLRIIRKKKSEAESAHLDPLKSLSVSAAVRRSSAS